MNGYLSYSEIQSVMADRLPRKKRERIVLNPSRHVWMHDVVRAVLSFLF